MQLNPLKPRTERIADGVWRCAGDLKQAMNVYLLEDGDGVTIFDGGTASMTEGVREAATQIGPIKRIVLGHGHADHRGIAPDLGVPVLCHPAERADAEGDGGLHYFSIDQIPFRIPRLAYPTLLAGWDGGPVEIADTVEEGDDVCGFEARHFPGHAPGMIALWRERDRLALVTDVVYTVDPMNLTSLHWPVRRREWPSVPNRAFNQDHEQAKASVRKLAELEPATIAPGHAAPLSGDPEYLRMLLEQAAIRG